MYTYNNIVCIHNKEIDEPDHTPYRDFCYNNIPNFKFDTSYDNKTLFVVKQGRITSVFKLDVLTNIFCLSSLYINQNYFLNVDDVNYIFNDLITFIIHTIKLTSNTQNITYKMCNLISFKIYMYCNVDIGTKLYDKKLRSNCSKTIIDTVICHKNSTEFLKNVYFDHKFEMCKKSKTKTVETQTIKQPVDTAQNAFSQPQTSPLQNAFSQPTNTFLQPQTSPLRNTFSQPTNTFSQPNNTFSQPQTSPLRNAFSQPQPTNTFSQPNNTFSQPKIAFAQPKTQPQNTANVWGGNNNMWGAFNK